MGNVGVEADVMLRSTFALLPLYHCYGQGIEGFDNVYPTMAIISQCTFDPGQDKLYFLVG